MSKSYKELMNQITTFIFDVDGVLTDGTIHVTPTGEMLRNMNIRDGYAMKAAVENGYTVAWGSDVSEKGFTRNGIGLLPETKAENLNGTDQAKWVGKQKDMKYDIKGPMIEEKVTQESRQKGFDNYQTTDDHGMLIYGIAKDQNGTPYYMVKNSWGTDNKYKGTWYVSKPFVMSKTINILVHKDAVPKDIRKKLGI